MAARIVSYETVLVTDYVNIVDGWEKLRIIGSERRSGVDGRLKANTITTIETINNRLSNYDATEKRCREISKQSLGLIGSLYSMKRKTTALEAEA